MRRCCSVNGKVEGDDVQAQPRPRESELDDERAALTCASAVREDIGRAGNGGVRLPRAIEERRCVGSRRSRRDAPGPLPVSTGIQLSGNVQLRL